MVEAQPRGGQRYRQGASVCASISVNGAATVNVETWRDGLGATIAVVSIPYGGGAWSVTCGGANHRVDPTSPACAQDPWVRAHNPHALPCPLDRGEACRTR